jgi:4-hydroxy-tetrahydrodipicolinate synthase
LPLVRYEQQGVGLATRKYVMMKRGILATDAPRKPGVGLSATAETEVDYLLTRLARRDRRSRGLKSVNGGPEQPTSAARSRRWRGAQFISIQTAHPAR